MVRKSGKHGVRSGNTLRMSNTRYNKQYQADSCIVRNSANLNRRQSSQVADDALLDADGVLYSLNKKGRWGLPKLIMENIRQEENDVKISMFQRHKLTRQSNCVDFCSNKGQVQSVVATHGYFSSTCERNGNKREKNKKGRQQAGQSLKKEGQTFDPDPEITYDVLYPSPVTSSISHNSKYTRSAELIVYYDGDEREAGRISKKKGKTHCVNLDAQSDEEEWDSFDDQESENENTIPREEVKSPELTLIDILEYAERAKQLCSEKTKRRRAKTKKKNVLSYEDEWVVLSDREEDDEANSTADEESIDSSTATVQVFPPTPKLESVRVILQCDTIHPHQLSDNFHERYREAECRPRKFIIDITEEVVGAMRKSKSANMVFLGSLDFSSCVVFSRDASYDQGLDVYRVHLNININVNTIRIETLFDLMHASVEEVVRAAASYATFFPTEVFQKVELSEVARSTQKCMFIQMVPAVNKWKSQSVPLQLVTHDEMGFGKISEDDVAGAIATIGENSAEEGMRPEYCNICFDKINSELLDSASASSLIQCDHWFCNECWKKHIMGRIHSGAMKIKCPEYNCDTLIDIATLLSLVNIKHANIYQKLRRTADVERSPDMKWCPNPKCGRVLKTLNAGLESVTVNCDCGKVVCFSCLKDAHWPASCEQSTQYTQKLKEFGDDNVISQDLLQVHVRGKQCPGCKRYIQKNGGCKCMQCICGYAFCWTCLGSWNWNGINSHASCYHKSDTYKTQKMIVRHIDTSRKTSTMYKMAVAHRARRKPRHVRSLKSTVNSLSIQLRSRLSKGHDIGEKGILLGDGSPVAAADVHDFLLQMMQLKLELHHVIEHTAALLDQQRHRTGSRKLVHICKRLDWICFSLEVNFAGKGRDELLRAVLTLSHLRLLSRREVTSLVSALTHVATVAGDFT